MTRKSIFSKLIAIVIALSFVFIPISNNLTYAANLTRWILLSDYNKNMSVGSDFYLCAVTSSGKDPTYKSSDSKIASVSRYGLVTSKRAGKCTITVKAGGCEAYCNINVVPTRITLDKTHIDTECNRIHRIKVSSSTGHPVKWKSSKSSIVSVNDSGIITAKKIGSATITATVDGISRACTVTVKPPTISLNYTNKKMYRTQSFRLVADVSSSKKPTWKSNKSSVATVDEYGVVRAKKHGTATITATVDGVSKSCTVIVEQPKITLSLTSFHIGVGKSYTLRADVSSNVKPTWSSSNINIVEVDENGVVHARQKGKAYIYAKEDGVKKSCIVTVFE